MECRGYSRILQTTAVMRPFSRGWLSAIMRAMATRARSEIFRLPSSVRLDLLRVRNMIKRKDAMRLLPSKKGWSLIMK